VAALRHATGATPVATGKPDPTMHRESVERSGAQRPIVVGDRLDTDIEGARRVGCPSLLVLTGGTTAADLLLAPEQMRPDFLAADLGGLLHPHPALTVDSSVATCGAWTVAVDAGELHLAGASGRPEPGTPPVDDLDPLRALSAAAWAAADRNNGPPNEWRCVAETSAAADALRLLHLA
jgi:hypothetical protein